MNIKKMMQQAAKMQRDMERMQEELGEQTVEFSAGGGMVTAVARCNGTIESISIDPQVIDPEDKEMLEDLVTAAVEGALAAAKEKSDAEMSKLTSGMGLPGGGIPGLGL
jgi:DNA-binding YbaB/EbfC family protein